MPTWPGYVVKMMRELYMDVDFDCDSSGGFPVSTSDSVSLAAGLSVGSNKLA
jgi:hypothetical protein